MRNQKDRFLAKKEVFGEGHRNRCMFCLALQMKIDKEIIKVFLIPTLPNPSVLRKIRRWQGLQADIG